MPMATFGMDRGRGFNHMIGAPVSDERRHVCWLNLGKLVRGSLRQEERL